VSELGAGQHVRSDLRRRIELVSMDRYCEDVTVALYAMDAELAGVVHSYGGGPDVPARLAWIAAAMREIGGMGGSGVTVVFPCGAWHERAARRLFLEACKLDPSRPVAARPLEVFDSRTDQAVAAESLGGGAWSITSVATDPGTTSRATAVAAGLAKLADVEVSPANETVVRFPCGTPHERLVGVLLPRAINVRAALREQELAAGRGVLVAPSAQEAIPS
jgi:hypothetical protein